LANVGFKIFNTSWTRCSPLSLFQHLIATAFSVNCN